MNHAGMGAHAGLGVAASFVAMWMAMMVPMMLPSLALALRAYHRMADRPGATRRPGWSMVAVAASYHAVWLAVGVALLPLHVAAGVVERWLLAPAHARPLVVGVVMVAAGAAQLTAWKAHHLACCRAPSMHGAGAWRHGVRLGLHCCLSCAGPMAILVVVGVMDLRAMVVVTAAITAERVARDGRRIERAFGVLAIGAGLLLIARAALAAPA